MKEQKGLGGILGGILGLGMMMGDDSPLPLMEMMGLLPPGMGLLPGMVSDDEAERLLDGKTVPEMIEVTRKEFEKAEAKMEEYRKDVAQIMERKSKLEQALSQQSPEAKANRSAIEVAALSILEGVEKAHPDFFSSLEENLKEKSESLARAKKIFEMTAPVMIRAYEAIEKREKIFAQRREEDKKQKEEAADLRSKALFKPSDKVRISKNPARPNDAPGFTKEMKTFKGKVVTIETFCPGYSVLLGEPTYHIVELGDHCAERWLEPANQKQQSKKLQAPKKIT